MLVKFICMRLLVRRVLAIAECAVSLAIVERVDVSLVPVE